MKIYQVDSFTDVPFKGNPAGVCLLDGPRPDPWMQGVAAEMNLSETAFLLIGADRFSLRWFTPTTEVSLCGHATLAAAHILWQEGILAPEAEARFDTLSGELLARTSGSWIEMDFPIRRLEPCAAVPDIESALGTRAVATGVRVSPKGNAYLLELAAEEQVVSLAPDFRALRSTDARSVMVTSRTARTGIDFVSRFFAPGAGIDEDPVTGSAHCYLAPYWAEKLDKTELVGLQVSARSGIVGCSPRGERVLLRGQAVTTIRGELVA